MLTANQIITVFNARTDKEKRREIFIPTNIFGVSFYELDSSKFVGGVRSEEITCKIRIPFGARIEAGAYDIDRPITKEELTALCHESRYTGPLISVVEYADNTQRGSLAVKHWRIGGK